jgi:hypothetical protein
VLLTSPTPLHDLGSLIFRDNALHLEQQIIFGALAEGPVEEHQLHTSPAPFVEEQDLVCVVAGQAVW